jgi:hypothetical protein
MRMLPTFRIFLSSPGDVATERDKARELLLGIARGEFVRDRVHIDVVSWDDPYAPSQMDARLTPQQAVDRSLPTPAECCAWRIADFLSILEFAIHKAGSLHY